MGPGIPLRAYNDWLAQFYAHAPKRLFGVAVLPAEDPEGATAEVYRLAKQGGIHSHHLTCIRDGKGPRDQTLLPYFRVAMCSGGS